MFILLAFNSFVVAKDESNTMQNLSQEVKDFYDIQPLSLDKLEQNLYIWGVGLNYPKSNFYDIGRKVVQANYALGQEMQSGVLDIWGMQKKAERISLYLQDNEALLNFYHPFIAENSRKSINRCNRYNDHDCIQKTIADETQIRVLNDKNKELQQRYEDISKYIDKSVGYFHPYSFASSAYPDMASVIRLLDLDAANAVLELYYGDRTKAIERLSRINFFANIEHHGALTMPLLQLNIQQALNQTINALLDQQLLDAGDPFLTKLYSQDIERFRLKLQQSLRWQAKITTQNNLYLYQDYKSRLMDLVHDDAIALAAENDVANRLYEYYQRYEDLLIQENITVESFQKIVPYIEGVPFNVYLISPYEYLKQAQYQQAYEKLLRTKIRILKGDRLPVDDIVQLDELNSRLYIHLDDELEFGSPLLPQPMRWFDANQPFLSLLEVAIPNVK